MNYKNRIISPSATLLEALKQMDAIDRKLLIVLQEEAFIGLLSAGDIQRAIIANYPMETEVRGVLRQNIRVGKPEDSIEQIREIMKAFRMELFPVVNNEGKIERLYIWEDVFLGVEKRQQEQFSLPVVIMAGGYGTRLRPLTYVLPKPLIPIGKMTMLEEIFERFGSHGCSDFFISVNYKSELIEFYLKSQNLPFNLNFFKEEKPLGTAGSLTLLRDRIKDTFFVNNCDILIEDDYAEMLRYHKEHQNEITLIAVLKTYPIPYGTVETGDNGVLTSLKEKPELTFKINSGMYLLEPHLLNEIPIDEFFHITHLIEKVKGRGGNVGVYPVSQGSWKDMGDWEEYLGLIGR